MTKGADQVALNVAMSDAQAPDSVLPDTPLFWGVLCLVAHA
jgi:hypothetical protein